MTIEILTKFEPDYVHVYCVGTFESDAMLDVWQSAFRVAVNKGYKAVLVDVRGINGEPPNEFERFDHGVRLAYLQRHYGNDIVIAVVGDEPMIDPERLGEIIARNHGAFICVFTDIVEAVKWIETEVANAKELEISLQRRFESSASEFDKRAQED